MFLPLSLKSIKTYFKNKEDEVASNQRPWPPNPLRSRVILSRRLERSFSERGVPVPVGYGNRLCQLPATQQSRTDVCTRGCAS